MTLLNQWFIRRRSTAMAVAMTGMGLGALILVPAIAWAVDPDQDRLGWRLTAGVLGIVMVASAVVIPRLIRNRPQDYNQLPDGGPPKSEQAALQPQQGNLAQSRSSRLPETDFTTGQALRTSAFWFISFGHGLSSMVILAIMTHLGLLMVRDEGFSVQTMAWIVTVYTAVRCYSSFLAVTWAIECPRTEPVCFRFYTGRSSAAAQSFLQPAGLLLVRGCCSEWGSVDAIL